MRFTTKIYDLLIDCEQFPLVVFTRDTHYVGLAVLSGWSGQASQFR